MAVRARAHTDNVAGEWFVDTGCIDCDTCRQIAPATFAEAGGHARVACQPQDDAEHQAATRALLSCPTGAIGSGADRIALPARSLPWPLDARVRYCGYTSAASFGALSYLLSHPDGNWMIDAPRWVPALARSIQELGGISRIFLTHRDDCADAERYASHFAAQRVIHEADRQAQPGAEIVLTGRERVELGHGIHALPVPGHTKGSLALLVDGTYAFTGDHVWWSRVQRRLVASQSVCWHSWSEQTASMERLAEERFSMLLPGHGGRHAAADASDMQAELRALAGRMRASGGLDPDDW